MDFGGVSLAHCEAFQEFVMEAGVVTVVEVVEITQPYRAVESVPSGNRLKDFRSVCALFCDRDYQKYQQSRDQVLHEFLRYSSKTHLG